MDVGIVSRQGDVASLEALLTAAGHKPVAVPLAESSTPPPSMVVGFLSMRDEVSPIVSWTRRMRRDRFFAGNVVFLSFLANRATRNRWSITGIGVPGTSFVRLPSSLHHLVGAVPSAAEMLSPTDLESVVREHCCTTSDVRELVHDLANQAARLGSFPQANIAREVLATSANRLDSLSTILRARAEFMLAECCRSLAGRCSDGVEPLIELGSRVSQLIGAINAAIFGDFDGLRWSPDGPPADSAPRSLDSLLIVDDDGYPADAEDYLRKLGYAITVVRNPAEALERLRYDPSAAVVSDLNFNADPQAGSRLFEELRRLPSAPTLVAISSDREFSARPLVDGFCLGPLAKTRDGATRLHAVLSTLARARA